MSVASTGNRAGPYACNGVTTTFSFPYYFLAQSDLVVMIDDGAGNIVTKTLTTDYTITGTQAANGTYPSGGSVVFGVAPASGSLSIVRKPAFTQASHWVDGDADPAAVKETAFDKATLLIQYLLDRAARVPFLPDGFAKTFNNQLPALIPANSTLATNPTGDGWVLVAGTANPGTVTSVGLSVPGEFSAGAPVTSSGTLTITKLNQSANQVWAGPTSGGAAQPTFRSLVAADIPTLSITSMSSGAATNGQVLVANGSGGATWQSIAGSGTVTSVGVTVPSEFIAGGAVTTAGNVSFTKATQTANTVWAGPTTGAPGQPTFRNLVAADLPALAGATNIANGAAGVVPQPLAGQQADFLRGDGTWAAGNPGTVTSISVAMPAEFSVSPASITSSGTFTVSKVNQSANLFYAGPGTGAAAAPAFRAIVPVDLPIMVGASGLSAGVAGTVPSPSAGQQAYFLRGDGSWSTVGAGTGTVQSVGLSLPADFTVSGSPVTGIGTLTAVYANQNANLVHAGPSSGGAAAPTWRSLVVADLPTGYLATNLSSGAAGNGQILTANGLGAATWQNAPATGVTSVGMTVPGFLSVSGSPITTSGTLAVSLATQAANLVFAGPTSGVAVAPTFRSLVAADIPTLAVTSMSSGVASNGQVATANGAGGITWTTPAATGVTSVGLSLPADFTVSGSPVTTTGTLTAVYAAQTKNTVHAGPASGANAAPTWRQLIIADIGSGAATSGQVPVADGAGGIAWGPGGGLSVSGTRAAPSSITAAGGVTSTSNPRQLIRVQGSGGAVTVTASPAISAGTSDGQELILEGSNATNTLTINNGTGVEQNGAVVLGLGDKIAYLWNAGAAVWTEAWRSPNA